MPAMLKRQRSIIGARPSADAHAVVATRADAFPGGHARCFLWSFIRHKLRAARPFIVVLAARGKAPSGCGTKKQKALIAFAVSTITSTALRPCIRDRRSLLPPTRCCGGAGNAASAPAAVVATGQQQGRKQGKNQEQTGEGGHVYDSL